MKFLMLVATDPEPEPDLSVVPELEDWFAHVSGQGAWVMGERLRPPEDAATVRVRAGQRLVTDGPFTESKEWLAGFDVLECDDLDAAIDIAARHPMAHRGRIEVRQFWPIDEGDGQD